MGTSPISNNILKHHRADCESCYSEPPDPITNISNAQYASLFFSDGERSIDFVIVWQSVEDPIQEDLNCTKRAIYEDNLVNEGLELERETVEQIHFTKIHTPIEVLRRYSEILKLRMPMKEVISFYKSKSVPLILKHNHFILQSLSVVQDHCRNSHLSNAALFMKNKVSISHWVSGPRNISVEHHRYYFILILFALV